MASTRVTMPQLGESVHEGTISRWLVKPGDQVVEFEPMLEVDTDKVNAEVPAPVTGILREILAREGETVAAGAEIAVVELQGDAEAPATVELRAEDARPVQPAAVAPPTPSTAAPVVSKDGGEHRYSPGVLLLAEEHGVDLAQVEGTGLGGRVTKRDVRQFVEAQRGRAAAAAPASPVRPPAPAPTARPSPPAAPVPPPPVRPPAPAPTPPPARPPAPVPTPAEDQVVPLSRMRKLIAENVTRSKTTIPHAWQTQEVDMSGVVANRNANKPAFQEREGFSLTYLPYVIAAAIASLREHPEVNATFTETEIVIHGSVNLGVSVGFEDTLLVPVIRNADGLSMAGLARAVNDLATRARNRQLKADELQGGTFTVNNSGTFGTLFSYSVINPGQAGILTMEAIVQRPVAVSGMIAIKPMMYLCFSFDHRVLDGLQAARFLTSCRTWLEAVTADTPIY
ncbi:MAG TPA: dihydrolipoamide acetyltransferase family protein [Candidatus Dormibacteraeota bacterium]|nr:dihydrolipoamide acetyltransferase family protein [Candidatus Dormibacteraeota bacterium]